MSRAAEPAQAIGRRLSSRLIVLFVGMIVATAVAAAAIAYGLIATEMERQAWARVRNGERATLALLALERERLDALVTLSTQHPALRQALHDGDKRAIEAYVAQYQQGARVDLLLIHNANGELVARGETAVTCEPSFEKLTDYCLFLEEMPLLTLFGGNAIFAADGALLGYVTIGRTLNNNFAQELAAQTGVEHSFFVADERIASSLPASAPNLPAPLFAAVMQQGQPLSHTLAFAGGHYYALLYPLRLANNEVLAVGEIAVPVDDLMLARRQILLTLVASTLLIAATGSITAVLLRNAMQDEALQHLRAYFLASITHEFRTPLAALRASVEFLADEMTHLSRHEINDLLHAIHMSVSRLQTLIDNLLESVSIEAGQFAIRAKPIALSEPIQDAVRVMQPLLLRRRQQLQVLAPPDLPPVWGDSLRLTQVLVNLLGNASKYGPMEQTITISAELINGRFVRVSVVDQGPGVPPAMQEKLFRRFARLNLRDGVQHGLGLGLWVVNAIVTAHGGEVGVYSRPEGGAVFWFTVPLMEEE